MNTFRVKNFEKFQHYKDRSPPWIKLYNELLDDYEFGLLPDASKMHLIAIWLLASRSENKIPYDPKWVAGRINATEPVDLELLVRRGFILLDQEEKQVASNPVAKPEQVACPEREDIGKRKRKEDTRSASPPNENFENFKRDYPKRAGQYGWKAAERKYLALVKTGVDPKMIALALSRFAEEMRKLKRIGTEFVPMPASWLNSEDFVDVAVAVFDPGPARMQMDEAIRLFAQNGHWSRHAPVSDVSQAPAELLAKHGLLPDGRRCDQQQERTQ